jgi:hypothetical protein
MAIITQIKNTGIAPGTITAENLGTLANITISGPANLGNVANVKITGGSTGQALTTDGNGNLTFTTITSGNTTSLINGNSNVVVAANSNVTVSVNGNSNILTVTGTGVNVAGTGNFVGNISANFFIGNGSQLTGIGSAGSISNGTSNVNIPAANGNINLSVANISNVLVVTDTGIVVAGNANANIVEANTVNVATALNINGNTTFGSGTGGNITGANVITANAVNVVTSLTFGNGTGGNISNANVISANTINVSNNAVIAGNLTISGNLVYVNVETLSIEDPIIELQTGPNGAAPSSNTGKDVGTALNYYDTQARVAFMGWDVSNAEFGLASQASISSEVVTFSTYGNLRVGNIIGSGQALTNINGSNVTGQVANALVAGTVTTAAQPNITSIGILSSLAVTGNVSAGNISGTLVTANQPNITNVGTLSNLTSNGTINFINASNVSLGSVSNLKITGGTNDYVLSTDGTGNLSWVAQSGGGGSANIQILDEGNALTNAVASINFVGNAVVATANGNAVTVTINASSSNVNGDGGYVDVTRDSYLANGSQTAFNISQTPIDQNYALVFVDRVYQRNTDYSTTGNVLTFSSAPDANSTVDILTWGGGGAGGYEITVDNFTGNGVQTAYTLSTTPLNENYTFVNIQGIEQLRNAYSVSGNVLTFSSAPSNGYEIEVTTLAVTANSGTMTTTVNSFTGNGVQTVFTLNPTPLNEDYTLVNIDGIIQLKTAYSVSGNALTFSAPPDNGSNIEVQIFTSAQGTGGALINGTSNLKVYTSGNIAASVNGVANTVVITNTGLHTGNLSANYVQGLLTTAAQPNITSVGILSSLTSTGTITAVSFVETSSIAFKENVNPITNALDSILQLAGVTYDRKDGSKKNEAGLIAEDVVNVLPNLIGYDEKGNPIGINYTKLTAYLIEAIKELKKEIQELKNK